MKLIEFMNASTDTAVFINPEQVVSVERYDAEQTFITTTADANGLHRILVDEEVLTVVERLQTVSPE